MTSTHQKTSNISVIIPTLNEEESLKALPASLFDPAGEVIIVDGDSSDGTRRIAKEKGFRVERSKPGRAVQLNLGAGCATGDVLLFMHADTQPPTGFTQHILQALSNQQIIAGAFSLAIKDATGTMAFIAHCANLRSRLFQLPYGDQAIFIRKQDFIRYGPFPELPIMEDYAFITLLRKQGKIVTLPQRVLTSSRRWQRLGVLRTTVINQLLILGYTLKLDPQKLASLYRR